MDNDTIDAEYEVKPEAPPETPEVWAVVEMFGHIKMAGRLTEEERFGGKAGRLDIPTESGAYATSYFTSSSLFRLTIVTEATARAVAKQSWPRPVEPYEPKRLTDSSFLVEDDDREFDPRDEDDIEF